MVDTSEGELHRRIAARAILQDPTRPPSFVIEVVDKKYDVVQQRWIPFKRDSHRATAGGKEYMRLETESLEEFKDRVWNDQPLGPMPSFVILYPDPDDAPPAP